MIVDIGANTGQFVEKMRAARCDLPVLSFEPIAECHATLEHKARMAKDWTIAPRMALGDHQGQLTIHKLRDSSLSSALKPIRSDGKPENIDIVGTETVPLTTLDQALAPYPGAQKLFIKLDVQGTERAVLAGATEALKRCVGFHIELGFNPLYDGENSYLEMLTILDAAGFYPVYVAPILSRQKLGPVSQVDMILHRRT